jgi:hypothetical protein
MSLSRTQRTKLKRFSKQESCIGIDSLVLSDLLAKAGMLSEYAQVFLLVFLTDLLISASASLSSVSLLIMPS